METSNQSTPAIADVHRIKIGIDWPPGNVGVYLIDGPEPILVDAGMPDEATLDAVESGLAAVERSLSDIEHLLITHPHVDHIGQLPAIVEAADPTVYAPIGVRDRLTQEPEQLAETVRENGTAAGLSGASLDAAIEKSVDSLERNRALFDPETVDHWIEHGETFSIGGLELRGIHTPGHQADHFCYYGALDGEPILFSGDLLLEPFRSVMLNAGLDTGVERGVSDFYTALDRLDGLDVRRVFPGHGPAHERFDELIERSRESLDRLLAKTSDRVADGPVTALEIAIERSGEREIHYVVPEVVSALHHLQQTGEIGRTVEQGVNRYETE